MDISLSIEEEGSGERREATVSVEDGATVRDVLSAAEIDPETVLVERDGAVIPQGADVSGDDDIRVLRVVSGG